MHLNLCTAVSLITGQQEQHVIALAINTGLAMQRIYLMFYVWLFWRLEAGWILYWNEAFTCSHTGSLARGLYEIKNKIKIK